MVKKLNEHDKKEMRKNVESYNHKYGNFLESMKEIGSDVLSVVRTCPTDRFYFI